MQFSTYALCATLAALACSASRHKLSQRQRKLLRQAGISDPTGYDRNDLESAGQKGTSNAWAPVSRTSSGLRDIMHDQMTEKVTKRQPAPMTAEHKVAYDSKFPELKSEVITKAAKARDSMDFVRRSPLVSTLSPEERVDWERDRTMFTMLPADAHSDAYDTSFAAIAEMHTFAQDIAGSLGEFHTKITEITAIRNKAVRTKRDARAEKELQSMLNDMQSVLEITSEIVLSMARGLPSANALPPQVPMDRRSRASPLISVATLNAQFLMDDPSKTLGTWETPLALVRHMHTVAQMLAEMDSDVIVVNEVGSFGALELARAFMGAKGNDYRVYMLPKRDDGIAPAFLSRIDIVHPLMAPKVREGFYLRCTVARFEVFLDAAGAEKQSVEVYGTHLVSNKASPTSSSLSRRQEQAVVIRNAVDQAMSLEPKTVFVIAGDMNEEDPRLDGSAGIHPTAVFTAMRVFGNLVSCYDNIASVPPTHRDRVLDYVFAPQAALEGIVTFAKHMGTLTIPRGAFDGKPGDHAGVCARLLIPNLPASLYVTSSFERHSVDDIADGVKDLALESPMTKGDASPQLKGDFSFQLKAETTEGDQKKATLNANAPEFVPRHLAAGTRESALQSPPAPKGGYQRRDTHHVHGQRMFWTQSDVANLAEQDKPAGRGVPQRKGACKPDGTEEN